MFSFNREYLNQESVKAKTIELEDDYQFAYENVRLWEFLWSQGTGQCTVRECGAVQPTILVSRHSVSSNTHVRPHIDNTTNTDTSMIICEAITTKAKYKVYILEDEI